MRCRAFDADLMADLTHAGGERYALLCALAYRQTFAGNKLAADANGKPLLFPKQSFCNGCISTVEVLFSQAPFFLALNPELSKAMLIPVLNYASSPRWPYDYTPRNLGLYPFATGQGFGTTMLDGIPEPVEDIGNMLIMLTALAKWQGNAKFAESWWTTVSKWTAYLIANGLDSENTLSAREFGLHSCHADQVLQAIIGIGGYARLCELAGKREEAAKHRTIARDFASKWTEMAKEDGRAREFYHPPMWWGLKHNLIWDRVLGLNLIPESVGDQEIEWMLKVQSDPYGPPINTGTESGLIDWSLWGIASARDRKDFESLLKPIFRYAHETPTRAPLAEWFDTAKGTQRGDKASPAVGGIFIKLLSDPDLWAKWARRAASTPGAWAPLTVSDPATLTEVVPTARQAPANWKYTLEKPGDNWFRPEYDDAGWKEGPSGFGAADTPGATVRTDWSTKEIWLRRTVELPDKPLKNPSLVAYFDEDATVYVNGVLAADLVGFVTAYDYFNLTPEGLAALRPGRNLLAIHAQQTNDRQYIDVGLAADLW